VKISLNPLGKRVRDLCLFLLVALVVSPAHSQTQSPQSPATAAIEGTVRDANGQSVANATVSLLDQSGTKSAVTKTGVDGTFVFPALRAGSFTIKAEQVDSHESATRSLELAAAEKKHLDLVLGAQAPATDAAAHAVRASSTPNKIEFSDQPNFTVAGITDWSNLGLHGSDVTARTSETLAKDTAALKSEGPHESPKESSASNSINAATVHRLAGDRDERSGDPVAAVREYEDAVRLAPSEENYFAWGSELLLHRAAQPAVEVFTKGSELHPKSARMLEGLGAALYASGLYDQAASRLCAASDLNPADPAPYLSLGKMQETAADSLPCAEEKLARFAHEQPSNGLANYYYAISIWKQQRRAENSISFPKAEALLEKAVALDPAFADAYLQLGILYSAESDLTNAKKALNQAIAINPQLGEAHYRLGQVYKRTGEDSKAEQQFAIYKQCEKAEAEALERQRKELRQFQVIPKAAPPAAPPQ
jgi:tetratricopeptide (TPR) repeat protein